MYDARNEPREFVGTSRSEAIAKACAHFGTDEGALRISEPGTGEVYGLSTRFVVVAIPADAAQSRRPAPSRGPREEGGFREREGRERGGRERGGRERGGRDRGGRDRDRGERSDRGERGGREAAVERAPRASLT